jgi:hypothetical protein
MRLNLFAAVIMLVVAISCGSKKTAFEYSEKLVSIEKSLVPDITETESKVGQFFTSGEYDSARIVSQRMEDKISKKMKEIEDNAPPAVEEAENFKKAFLKYFAYMKSVYTSYTKYAMQTNDEERATVWEEMMKVINGKQDAISEMQRMQAKFAKANGFSLDNEAK